MRGIGFKLLVFGIGFMTGIASSMLLPETNEPHGPTAWPIVVGGNRLVPNNAYDSNSQPKINTAWAPVPKAGTLLVSVDGGPTVNFPVEGSEKMGNGSQVIAGPAAIFLHSSKGQGTKILLPGRMLTVSNLFPNESVVFPFEGLNEQARRLLSPCFSKDSPI